MLCKSFGSMRCQSSATERGLLIISLLLITGVVPVVAGGCGSDASNELSPINAEGESGTFDRLAAGVSAAGGNHASAGIQTVVAGVGGGGAGQSVAGVGGGTAKPGTSTAGKSGAAGEAGAQHQAGTQAGQSGANAGQGGVSGVNNGTTDYSKPGPYKVTIEKNVGEKFRNNSVYDDSLQCRTFIAAAASGDPNADPEVLEQLTSYPSDMDRGLYTLFRPETLEAGKKYPVITWGNGTCSQPFLFEELLTHLTSHGFIIIASNWRWVASGQEMLNGINFILSENENASSPLYGKIDTKMLGACGHSQGSMATVVVGADKRIVTTVPIQGANASDVAKLVGPTFMIAGEVDTIVDPSTVETAFNAATVPAFFGLCMGKDHLMPGLDPSPILKPITAWFKIHLADDQKSRDLFYGDSCGLCNDPAWKIQRKNM
jgi:hypothetical protein